MEQDFSRGRMQDRHGIELILPGAEDRDEVHRVIFEELCRGQILEGSRVRYQRIVSEMGAAGAEGVILGCTEICLLLDPSADSPTPLFDGTALHARAAVDWILGGTTST
jgi:aspartate racemase